MIILKIVNNPIIVIPFKGFFATFCNIIPYSTENIYVEHLPNKKVTHKLVKFIKQI